MMAWIEVSLAAAMPATPGPDRPWGRRYDGHGVALSEPDGLACGRGIGHAAASVATGDERPGRGIGQEAKEDLVAQQPA
jgi:hypothetical protein